MFKNLQLSNAQTFVMHSLISLLVGAIVAGGTAITQSVFTSGITPQLMLSTGIAAFGAWFVHGFVSLRNNPQTVQAEADTLNEIKHSIAALITSHQSLVSFLANPPTPAPQPAPRPQPAPAPAPSPVPQSVTLSQLVSLVGDEVTRRIQAAQQPIADYPTQTGLPVPQVVRASTPPPPMYGG